MANLIEINKLTRNEIVSSFIQQLDTAETTKKTYSKSLKVFTKWLNDNQVTHFTTLTMLEYKDYLRDHYKPNSTNTYLVALKRLFNYLESQGLAQDVARNVKTVKAPQGFSKSALTVDQAISLLNSFDRSTLKGKRDYALLNLMINTALRVHEIHLADVKDIDTNSGKALLHIQGKGRESKDSFVILEANVLASIYDYLTARGNHEGALFKGLSNSSKDRLAKGSISRIVKEAFRSIGLDTPKLTAHSTRHTAITLSLIGGASIQEAQAMARHSNINTTLIYAHNLDRISNSAESKINSLLNGKEA